MRLVQCLLGTLCLNAVITGARFLSFNLENRS